MSGPSESSDRRGEGDVRPPDELERLRILLLAPERRQIEELRRRLETDGQAQGVSLVLPRAVRLSVARDGQLSRELAPAVESALKESVRRDPSVLAEAVSPIIGAAIRKAIAEAFATMLQSLNQTLEHSISIQGLKWRFEAFRTGKSFAEVVLSRTLVFRVEEVFLIHKGSGLLLQHVRSADVTVLDSDMISGMLTAIQDFARDSFQVAKGAGLETLQVGDLNVWIESRSEATLAAVIRGVAPHDFRFVLHDALQRIAVEHYAALDTFSGDPAAFDAVRPILEDCLRSQISERAAKPSRLLWVFPLLVLTAVLYGAVHVAERRTAERRRMAAERAQIRSDEEKRRAAEAAGEARWRNFLDRIKSQEGIVVTEALRRDGKIWLSGLRDPLGADPVRFAVDAGFDPASFVSRWELYYALSPGIVLKRAIDRLRPPAGVVLRWKDDTLMAEGRATSAWIVESRRRAETIPGVAAYDATAVLDEAAAELGPEKAEIEGTAVHFGDGVQILPDQMALVHRLSRQISGLLIAGRRTGRRVGVTVTGHTTEKGSELLNLNLGRQRAEKIVGLLTQDGVEGSALTPVSVGSREPESRGSTEEEDARNRRVTFRVAIDEPTRNAPTR